MKFAPKYLVKRRRVALVSGVILGVGLIALAAPVAVRGVAHSGLSALGFGDARGGSVSLGLRHITIAGIRIGGKGAATVTVTYSPGRLIHGQLDTIAVTDTSLHGVVALNGTVSLDGYTALPHAPAKPISLPADQILIRDVALELETPIGKSTLTGSGTLTGTEGGVHLTGTVALAGGAATGSAPADFTLSAAGWTLSMNPIQIALPSQNGAANAVTGHLSLGSQSGGVVGDAELDGQNLTIDAIAIRTLSLGFKTGPAGQSAAFLLSPANGSAGIDATLAGNEAGMVATVKAAFAEVGPFAKALGSDGVAGPIRADLTLHIGPAAAQRPITLNLAYTGAMPGGAKLGNAKFQAAGTFDRTVNAVTLTSCGGFSAESAAVAGAALSKLSGCLGPSADHPLFSQDAQGHVSLAGAIENFAVTVNSGAVAQLSVKALHGAVGIADGRVAAFDLGLDGGLLDLPGLGAGLRDIAVKATGTAPDAPLSGTLTASFSAAGPKGPSLPVTATLSGSLSGGASLALGAGSANHLPIVKASVTGRGARLEMAPTELGQGGADLLGLAPGLATKLSKVSGSLALTAVMDWPGQAMTSRGTISFANVGATTPNFTVEGLDATVTLSGLAPLTIPDNQKLTMKRLLVGVPLTDGQITFGLDRNRRLKIADAHWSVAGGTIGTYDQLLDLYGPDQNLGVVVKGVNLAELLKLLNVGGLSAEGTLMGAIPLRHTKDTILVEHGYLQTAAAGIIRYDPADTPSFLQGPSGGGTAILRDALKDFHYRELSMTIDGVLGEQEQIKLKLSGANPALYGGLPVALNVNLSGALDSIARSSIEAYTHPTETARRKIQNKSGEKK